MEVFIRDESQRLSADHLKLAEDLLDLAQEKLDLDPDTEMSLTFVDNHKIQEINRDYRNIDRPTDVISFAINDEMDEEDLLNLDQFEDLALELGDIFVSVDKAEEQARDYGHSFERELGFLVVHGFLHLNGYDHQTEEEEKEMFSLQESILEAYGLGR